MFLRPQGHFVEVDGMGKAWPEDTYTCRHHGAPGCCGVVFVKAKQDPNEFWCQCCMAPICRNCKAREWRRPAGVPCEHFERNLDRAERRDRLYQEMRSS